MTTPQRIAIGGSLLVVCAGLASANTFSSTATFGIIGTTPTELNYTLTLQKFDTSNPNFVLTGATLFFFVTEQVSNLEVKNNASTTQTFNVTALSNAVSTFANSATAADIYKFQTIDLFDTGGTGVSEFTTTPPGGPITLGAAGSGLCAVATPSSSCSDVFYTPPSINISNIDAVQNGTGSGSVQGTVGTGLAGVTGIMKTATSLANYSSIGASTFTLTGSTLGSQTFSGGGLNQTAAIATTANVRAEIDYTYTVVETGGTPEPATMLLFGSGLLGLGLLRKRVKN